ncbi:lipoprotein [Streptomyces capitiformicae]|uniref:Lipoprotein n=1 Tax=Streptomyces capitiformicae TaxID=2014920 RepID=A0A918ZGI4_9ACTN|nr:lipoprotein [Streptomyces capitiformicae]
MIAADVLLSGCTGGRAPAAPHNSANAEAHAGSPGRPAPQPQIVRPMEIPALGPKTRAQLTTSNRQAVVVTGDNRNSNQATVMLYERDAAQAWHAVSGPWRAHNALLGWTDDHRQGDLRSPIGVFGLTDAGGRLPDPGTRLPYEQESAFTASGTGFEGEPLTGAFDYVVAINYNRTPRTTPRDQTRPLGADKGGGIWIHVDHGGPTQGCISLPKGRMKELLRWLDPTKKPVVAMGHETALAK